MSTRAACMSSTIVLTIALFGLAETARAQVRRAQPGDKVASFSLPDIEGGTFTFLAPRERPTILVFVDAFQKRSERAVADIVGITDHARRDGRPIDLLIVVGGEDGHEHARPAVDAWAPQASILIDMDDALWGRLGIAVTPTTIIIDERGRIGGVRAGHGYDYVSTVRRALNATIGSAAAPHEIEPRATVLPSADDVEIRVARLVRLGRMLARRGDVETGIATLQDAEALAPGRAQVRLELAHLLCLAERPGDALNVTATLDPATVTESARTKLMSGWAHRLLGNLDEAHDLLEQSIALDPVSTRALFELGKIFEKLGDCEKAMSTYRRALAIQHGETPEQASPRSFTDSP